MKRVRPRGSVASDELPAPPPGLAKGSVASAGIVRGPTQSLSGATASVLRAKARPKQKQVRPSRVKQEVKEEPEPDMSKGQNIDCGAMGSAEVTTPVEEDDWSNPNSAVEEADGSEAPDAWEESSEDPAEQEPSCQRRGTFERGFFIRSLL